MRTPKWVVLLCVLSLLSLLLEPLQAYGVSPFSSLEVANSQNPPGAKVFATKENSLASQSDLRVNDVITSIEGHAVSSLDDFVRISKALKDKESVLLSINRGGKIVEVSLSKEPVGVAQPETKESAVPTAKETETKAPMPTTVAEGARIEDYFPIQDGAHWQYQVEAMIPKKTLFGTEYSKSASVVTVECKEGVNFQGQEAVMFLENRGGYPIKRYYRKERDAILYLGDEFVTPDKEQIYRALVPPVPFLRQPVTPFSAWEITTSIVGQEGKETTFKCSITVSKEKITVPAGQFDAIKVVSHTSFGEVTEWYAKETGLVKRVEVAEFHGLGNQTTKYELVSYSKATATAFVKKYKIQGVTKPEQLLSNPFVYKGKTIAVYLKFIMMVSENEALFGMGEESMGLPICIVKGVPSTLFTSGEYTLAVKVLGLTEPKGIKSVLGFEIDKVAHAEFAGYREGDITEDIKKVLVESETKQKGFENPVVPNATGVTYRHGQYPSEGNNTHPGIDIVADCGSPIHSFADGEVTDLIKDKKDPHFKFLGYMVIVKHSEAINGKDTYSLYLHMKEPPAVSKGQKVKAGDVLGKVGDTGNAKGCHVHFELRHFPDRFLNDKGWNYPLNIYGKGDQRNEKRFLDNWEDPEVYF